MTGSAVDCLPTVDPCSLGYWVQSDLGITFYFSLIRVYTGISPSQKVTHKTPKPEDEELTH